MPLLRPELAMDEVKTQLVGLLSRGYSWPELQREFKQIITPQRCNLKRWHMTEHVRHLRGYEHADSSSEANFPVGEVGKLKE